MKIEIQNQALNNPPAMHPVHLQQVINQMACKNCGTIMQRGSQCPRCKAWCR